MDNPNSLAYRALKAKSYNKRKSNYDFDRSLDTVSQELTPAAVANRAANATGNNSEMDQVTANYDEKLKQMEKSQGKRFQEMGKNSEQELDRMSKQIQQGDEQNLELSQSLRAAIEKLAASKQQQQEEGAGKSIEDDGEEKGQEEQSKQLAESDQEDFLIDPEAYVTSTKTLKDDVVKESNVTTAERIIKKAVNIGDAINVGSNIYRVTNTFGIRSGANSVAGREGKHSKGMDLVGYSKDGKTSNLPIVLTDSTLISIRKQGDGSIISPTKGASAGVYAVMRDKGTGKTFNYMHLDPSIWENKDKYLNKEYKRGDLIHEASSYRGSGSQTGPHIKVSISSVGADGKDLRDFDNPLNDPKPYLLYGKYVEEY